MAGLSREACDRCHKLKTRCERSSGFHACTRCTRLGKSCCYSPPGRTGRPVGSKRANKIAGAGGESRLDKTFGMLISMFLESRILQIFSRVFIPNPFSLIYCLFHVSCDADAYTVLFASLVPYSNTSL